MPVGGGEESGSLGDAKLLAVDVTLDRRPQRGVQPAPAAPRSFVRRVLVW